MVSKNAIQCPQCGCPLQIARDADLGMDAGEVEVTDAGEVIFALPYTEAFAAAAAALERVGTLKDSNLEEGYISGAVRYGLQSVSVTILVGQQTEKLTMATVEAVGDDVWGVAAENAAARLLDAMLHMDSGDELYEPDRVGVEPGVLMWAVLLFIVLVGVVVFILMSQGV